MNGIEIISTVNCANPVWTIKLVNLDDPMATMARTEGLLFDRILADLNAKDAAVVEEALSYKSQ